MRRKIKKLFGITDKDIRRMKNDNLTPRRVIGLMIEDGSPLYEPDTTTSWTIYGGAGSGKSTGVSVPCLMSMISDKSRAIILNDVKLGELAYQTIEYARAMGRKVAIIDDSHVMGGKFKGYRLSINPFDNLVCAHKRKSLDLLSEIETACLTILPEPDGQGPDRNFVFRQIPREFMAFAILALLKRNPKLATPGGMAALLGDPDMLESVIDIEAEEGDEVIRTRAIQLQKLRDNDGSDFGRHLSATLSAVRHFSVGTAMHDAGRGATVSIEDLLREKYVVYLVQNVRNAKRQAVVYGLYLTSLLSAQTQNDFGPTELVFDEAANTPAAKELIEGVTSFRAAGLRVLYIAQSRSDLQRQNSEKLISTLEDNTNIAWLKFSPEEAQRVSKLSGEIDTVKFNFGSSSANADFTSTIDTGREPLFTPDFLMNLPANEQIIFIPGLGFIHCLMVFQNEISGADQLSDNPQEGGRLEPDIKVHLPWWSDPRSGAAA